MQRNNKIWREAASIIILSKNITQVDKWNYKILTLKRSKTMEFMPNLYTFPGGVIEKSDSVKEWLHLFESFGLGHSYFNKIPHRNKAPIFKNYDERNEIPRYISLRISAIRETFEECGILFCKPAGIQQDNLKASHWASVLGGQEIKKWQIKVQKDANKFLDMCFKLKIYPDIHNLHEWSNWLTPFAMPRQYDTIFFIAAIDHLPPTEIDPSEIENVEWSDPDNYLKMNLEKKILFAPPQIYEISKAYNFYDISKLLQYAYVCSSKGCEQILPYRILANGINYTILPGDSLYPNRENLEKKELIKMVKLPESKQIHRLIHKDNFETEIIIDNFTPSDVLPFLYKKNKL